MKKSLYAAGLALALALASTSGAAKTFTWASFTASTVMESVACDDSAPSLTT